MKQLRKFAPLLLTAALLVSLCSCDQKTKSEKINTKDYSRTISLEISDGEVQIVHSDKKTEAAKNGAVLKSDDGVTVGAGADLTLMADENKSIYVQENTELRLEASGTPESGKTRICLESGSVLCNLEKPLAQEELFEIQTPDGTVSMTNGIVRVTVISENDTEYTLAEVFDGEAKAVVGTTGDIVDLEAGEAAMIAKNGKKYAFVLADEIDAEFWKSPETTGLILGKDGTGSPVLEIPYNKLPKPVLDQLIEYTQSGRTLAVPEQTLRSLTETEHDYRETVLVEPTCIEPGILELECALCGAKEERQIPAVGHTEVEIPEVLGTCAEESLSAGVKCSVCGEILVPQERIPAVSHQNEEIPAVDAGCETEGLTAGTRCKVCGEVTSEQQVIPAKGHTVELVPGREATCSKVGLTEGQRCTTCGKWLVTQKNTPVVPHDMETAAEVPPTCTEDGCTEGTVCRSCGKIGSGFERIPALGHTVEVIPGREPSCTEPGLTEGRSCTVCNAVLEAQEPIPMAEHTPETIPAAAATCAKYGLTEGSRCTVCGEILTAQERVEKQPHTPEIIPGREPTCARPGLTEGERCAVCKQVLTPQKTIHTLPHTPKSILGKYATCFREGCTDKIVCDVCGLVLDPGEVIPMTPHVRGGLTAIAPTTTQPGRTEGLACQICGYVIKAPEIIPKLSSAPTETP